MGKFILKFILFILPVFVLFSLPLWVYWRGKEFTPVDQVVSAQTSTTTAILYGLAYTNTSRPYKKALTEALNPQVLLVGTSRILRFHQSFFLPKYAFANAGNGIENISEFAPFIENLPADNQVKFVMVPLDPWLFKPGSENKVTPSQDGFALRLETLFTGEWRTVWGDYFSGKFSLSSLEDARQALPYIGVSALINHDGFLNDGSHFEGSMVADPNRVASVKAQIADDITQITTGNPYYEYGDTVSPIALADLENFLEVCKERGIEVVGFIPPYPHEVYEAYVDKKDPYAATVPVLSQDLSAAFNKYDDSFFDFGDAATAGIQDSEFIDTVHATDKADLRMLIDMAKQSPALAKYVSLPALESTLKNTTGDFVLTTP